MGCAAEAPRPIAHALAQVVAVVSSLLQSPGPAPPAAPMPAAAVPPLPPAFAEARAATWRARHAVLKFVQTFVFRNQTQVLGNGWLDALFHRVALCLLDPRVEVCARPGVGVRDAGGQRFA